MKALLVNELFYWIASHTFAMTKRVVVHDNVIARSAATKQSNKQDLLVRHYWLRYNAWPYYPGLCHL